MVDKGNKDKRRRAEIIGEKRLDSMDKIVKNEKK
jgi:hypothetical protein